MGENEIFKQARIEIYSSQRFGRAREGKGEVRYGLTYLRKD